MAIVKQERRVWLPKKHEEKRDAARYIRRVDEWHVEAEVMVCEDCRQAADLNDGEGTFLRHDALCVYRLEHDVPARGSRSDTEREVLKVLFKRAGILMGQSPDRARKAMKRLMEWKPERWPDGFKAKANGAEAGDEQAPLFSEAYLYPLFGKDDARTILALLNEVQRALGEE